MSKEDKSMSKLSDALMVVTGRDFDEEPVKRTKKAVRKPDQKRRKATPEEDLEEKKDKKPEKKADDRKPVSSEEAKFAAYDYANDKDKLSADVRTALKEGSLSDDLIRVLQVLFDKKAVRDLVSAQGDVRPPAPDFKLDFKFIHPDTKEECTDEAEKALESGINLDNLEKFNVKLYVFRANKDGSETEGTPEEYERVKKQIEEKLKKPDKPDK